MKVLCFTPSFNRYKMLRGCVQDINNQTYQDIFHSVNITMERSTHQKNYIQKIFDDVKTNKNSFIYTLNQHQHTNHINTILAVENYGDYDIFVKIDDDDIYKKDYIMNIVNYFKENDVDVLSSTIRYQLNGNIVRLVNAHNLGANPENCDFKIPATFAFNLKSFNLIKNLSKIYGFEDNMWRDVWCENKCIIREIDNTENVIWNIHGKNTTTANFLI